jgi:hypothetical protein
MNEILFLVESAPLFSRLMPEVPKGHPALGSMVMNIAANALGLDNAATPLGIKAMKELQTLFADKTGLIIRLVYYPICELEARLERSTALKWWDITISPKQVF